MLDKEKVLMYEYETSVPRDEPFIICKECMEHPDNGEHMLNIKEIEISKFTSTVCDDCKKLVTSTRKWSTNWTYNHFTN